MKYFRNYDFRGGSFLPPPLEVSVSKNGNKVEGLIMIPLNILTDPLVDLSRPFLMMFSLRRTNMASKNGNRIIHSAILVKKNNWLVVYYHLCNAYPIYMNHLDVNSVVMLFHIS